VLIGYVLCPVLVPVLILVVHDGAKVLVGYAEDSGLPGAAVEVQQINSSLQRCGTLGLLLKIIRMGVTLLQSDRWAAHPR